MSAANEKLTAVVFAILLVFSVVGVGVTFTGSVAAANAPTAELHSVDKAVVAGDETVNVTYNATASDGGSIDSATIQFLSDGVVEKGVDVSATGGTNGTAEVAPPSENGTYNVQLVVTDSNDNTVPSDTVKTVSVDTQSPAVGLSAPEEGAQRTTAPTITAEAADNVSVETVQFRIERDGQNYTGTSWTGNEAWVNATENGGDWEYDAPNDNGTYTVVARANDSVGHTTYSTDTQPESTQPVPGDDGVISYTLDPELPTLTNVSVTTGNNDGVVAVGDSVTISANASDVTSGVDTVTVDASPLGESEQLSLTNASGDAWNTTFTVSELTVPDGPHQLTANATDAFGQSATNSSNEFTIDTRAATFDTVNIDAEFIGVVEDNEIRVTATGIEDANGNTIDVGTVDVNITGQTPFDSASVDDGSINTTIDPTKLDNGTAAVGDDVSVTIDGATGKDDSVQLTHEVRALEEGWAAGSTPMPTEDVVISGNGTVTTYDESAPENWTSVTTEYMEQAGAGYYYNITTESARVGYVFKETKSTYTWELADGPNLVGVVAEVGETDGNTTLGTLKNYVNDPVASNLSRADFDIRKEPFGDGLVGYEDGSDSDTLPAYSPYYINVTSSKSEPITYTVGWDGYNPQ